MAQKRKKILIVFGTRPEAIKMAPLIKEFRKHPTEFDTKVCVTAQHREMLDQVLELFEIVPDYDLNIMQSGQDLYDVTVRVLLGMRSVLKEVQPNVVMVHGDTSTSTAAALAAFYQQIPVGHVEAGLRTHIIYSPWPEEMNRQLTGRLATYHFAPTTLSKKNLIAENVSHEKITVTGNTVIDALHWVIDRMNTDQSLDDFIIQRLFNFGLSAKKIDTWRAQHKPYMVNQTIHKRKMVLITGHRRENFGQGLKNVCEAIKVLAEQYGEVDFVYPMHLNPNVRRTIEKVFGCMDDYRHKNQNITQMQNIYFIEPLDYLPFVFLMSISYLVLTDSGGIQEEAPGMGKPVLVMRDTTERPEALDAGTVKLVGTNKSAIIHEISSLINDSRAYETMSKANNPYGDGKASERIVDFIQKILKSST